MERKRSGLPVLCMLLTVLIVSLSVFTVAGDDNIVFDDYVSNSQHSAGGTDSADDHADETADNEGTDTSGGYAGSGTSSAKSEYEENNDGDDTYISNNGTVFRIPRPADKTARVYDYAGLFTDAQKEALTKKIRSIEESKKADIVILTSRDVPKDAYDSMETTMRYARQFLVDNGFAENSFVCLLDMNNRMIWTAGSGKYKAEKYVDFEEKVYNDVLDGMRNQRYYDVCNTFLKDVYKLDNVAYAMMPTPFSLIISAVLSLITLVSLLAKHSSSQPVNNAKIAVKTLNFRQTGHNAIFLGKHTSQRRIVKEHHSSGGGGFSGGTHSGGGFSGGGGGFSGGGGHF